MRTPPEQVQCTPYHWDRISVPGHIHGIIGMSGPTRLKSWELVGRCQICWLLSETDRDILQTKVSVIWRIQINNRNSISTIRCMWLGFQCSRPCQRKSSPIQPFSPWKDQTDCFLLTSQSGFRTRTRRPILTPRRSWDCRDDLTVDCSIWPRPIFFFLSGFCQLSRVFFFFFWFLLFNFSVLSLMHTTASSAVSNQLPTSLPLAALCSLPSIDCILSPNYGALRSTYMSLGHDCLRHLGSLSLQYSPGGLNLQIDIHSLNLKLIHRNSIGQSHLSRVLCSQNHNPHNQSPLNM